MILTLPVAATLFLSTCCAVVTGQESSVDATCRGKYGYAPHPEYCHKYLLCIDGKATSYKCFGNSGFDPDLGRCVPNAPCCEANNPLADYSVEYDDLTTYECERSLDKNDPSAMQPITDGSVSHSEPIKLSGQSPPVSQTPSRSNAKHLRCTKGFKKLQSKCYKKVMRPQSWKKAQKTCHRMGAELVTIKSKPVMNFLKSLLKMKDEYIGYFWIGLNDQKQDKRYEWSDGSVLSRGDYSNWAKRAGSRNSRQKKCVKLSEWDRYQWLDGVCAEQNGFICEKRATKGGIKDKPTKGDPVKVGKGKKTTDRDPSSMQPPNPNCGLFGLDGPPPVGEVIGGEVAKVTEFPWQVSLRKNDQHKCGGSLIDGCWVLSAAHCFSLPYVFQGARPTHAVIGDFDTEAPEANEENLEIESVHIHPEWKGVPVPTNDVALLKLSQCTSHHTPICLPTSIDTDVDSVFSPCKVSGFGTMDPNLAVYPTKLQELSVPLVDRTSCESYYPAHGGSTSSSTLITDSMLCAGYTDGTKRDSCSGDSGGPLACQSRTSSKRIQLGIVSWGQGCADGRLPAAYARVASFLGWIRNTTNIDF